MESLVRDCQFPKKGGGSEKAMANYWQLLGVRCLGPNSGAFSDFPNISATWIDYETSMLRMPEDAGLLPSCQVKFRN